MEKIKRPVQRRMSVTPIARHSITQRLDASFRQNSNPDQNIRNIPHTANNTTRLYYRLKRTVFLSIFKDMVDEVRRRLAKLPPWAVSIGSIFKYRLVQLGLASIILVILLSE